MEKDYRVLVFGKAGCAKCKVLNKRLDSLLAKDEWQDFEKVYCDIETEEGLVEFCQSECVNPSRIPGLVVTKRNTGTGGYVRVRNLNPGDDKGVCKSSKLYTYVGIQTDYNSGGGVLTPKMLASVLEEARLR